MPFFTVTTKMAEERPPFLAEIERLVLQDWLDRQKKKWAIRRHEKKKRKIEDARSDFIASFQEHVLAHLSSYRTNIGEYVVVRSSASLKATFANNWDVSIIRQYPRLLVDCFTNEDFSASASKLHHHCKAAWNRFSAALAEQSSLHEINTFSAVIHIVCLRTTYQIAKFDSILTAFISAAHKKTFMIPSIKSPSDGTSPPRTP